MCDAAPGHQSTSPLQHHQRRHQLRQPHQHQSTLKSSPLCLRSPINSTSARSPVRKRGETRDGEGQNHPVNDHRGHHCHVFASDASPVNETRRVGLTRAEDVPASAPTLPLFGRAAATETGSVKPANDGYWFFNQWRVLFRHSRCLRSNGLRQ